MDALLITRLHPPRRPDRLLRREALLLRMHGALSRQLTLVSAPPGFGKSTLVSAWAAEVSRPVSWLSLDAQDNDPARFWNAVRTALQAGTGLPWPPGAPDEDGLADLVNALAAATPLVLVLEDYHRITSQPIHRQLALLLERQPSSLHLVLVTRADPPLPLARLRAHGQLHEVRAADLRLSEAQTHTFFHEVMGLPLADEEVHALAQRTEGWLAGLQLAALSLRQQDNPRAFIDQFTGRQQYVMEYLTEEVLAHLPEPIHTFLLATSLLDQLSAPLCDAVLEAAGSQELLQHLYVSNLFLIALDETRTWFRYHHLFAELLRARLVQTRGGDAAAVYRRRAAAWCEAQPMPEQAIRYALAARDEAHAVRLIEDHGHRALNRGETQLLGSWLAGLPPAAVAASAPLMVALAWVRMFSGEAVSLHEQLQGARDAWVAQESVGTLPARASWLAVPSQIETLAATVAMYAGRPGDALEHARQAITMIPAGTDREGAALLRGAAAYRLAQAYRALGDARAAAATLTAVCEDLLAAGTTLGMAMALADLVELWEQPGVEAEAASLCARAIAGVEARGEAEQPITGVLYAALAAARLHGEGIAEAQVLLARAEVLGRRGSVTALRIAAQVRARLRDGQPLSEPLSERERAVLALMGRGYSNQQIAEELAIALSTVKKHTGNIFGKLGVASRTQAILRAQALGLIAQVDERTIAPPRAW